MKKLLCLLLSVLFVLSFAACESEDDDRRSSRRSKKEQTVGSSDYEDAIDLMMKVFSCDISEKELKSMFPAVCWDYFEEEEDQPFDEIYDMVSSDLENSREYLEEEFGEDFHIEYEIVSKEKLDADDEALSEFVEEFKNIYGLDEFTVGDCYALEIEASMVGSNKEDPTEMSYHVIEIDGSWYVAEILLDGF